MKIKSNRTLNKVFSNLICALCRKVRGKFKRTGTNAKKGMVINMKNNKYICNPSQLFNVKEYKLLGGRADGLRAVDVDNGSGLMFTVLADRCMDFGRITFKGNNTNFLTPAGFVAPQYFTHRGIEFLNSFAAGFLTTCGLHNIGSPNTDGDTEHGLHGTISNVPAEQFGIRTIFDDNGIPSVVMNGTMKDGRLGGDNLTLTREIVCKYNENAIYFTDTVENFGSRKSTLMQLYHINLGYPLIDEDVEIIIPSKKVEARNEHAQSGIGEWNKLQKPTADYEEMCFYHTLKRDKDGNSIYGVYNKKLGIGVFVKFDTTNLCNFTEWKMMGEGEYVLGLEPSNARLEGAAAIRENGTMKYIAPGEKVKNTFKLIFVNGEKELANIKTEIAALN